MEPDHCCETCMYWDTKTPFYDAEIHIMGIHEGKGLCRIQSPRKLVGAVASYWPDSCKSDWCGEHCRDFSEDEN